MFEIREIKNKSEYNPLLIDKNAPFTQAWFYGEWQEAMGRKARRFEMRDNLETIGFFQIIKYPLFANKNILYIPHAPVLRSFSEGGARSDFLKIFRETLIQIAKEENAIFVRFDLPGRSFSEGGLAINKYFKKVPSYAEHSVYFQPKYEWVLNIDKPENELLGDMPKDSRYDIRYAENKGVTAEIFENNLISYLDDFYSLMGKTAQRGNFNLHPKEYYKNILINCEKNNNAFFAAAKHSGDIIAMNLVLIFGETAYVVFGGSDDKFKNLRAPRLVYWKGIIAAKNRGCKFYNFGAISYGDGYESYEGISEFKKGFGGKMLEHPDSYDLIIKSFWYWLYNLRKKFRIIIPVCYKCYSTHNKLEIKKHDEF
ncbi:MAG: peptidoglycan bridge formation glycyltransferase FemA/FemB family protein [Candidatus Azambacteria bacterium]|nr:peptidoglycan bridge formation glycyltransferase FemA/FemB family protein [Candidatus Azambacteria bacterium]